MVELKGASHVWRYTYPVLLQIPLRTSTHEIQEDCEWLRTYSGNDDMHIQRQGLKYCTKSVHDRGKRETLERMTHFSNIGLKLRVIRSVNTDIDHGDGLRRVRALLLDLQLKLEMIHSFVNARDHVG